MRQKRFLPGWDEQRVRKVLKHYEEQTEEEAVAEDEAAFEDRTQTIMVYPVQAGTYPGDGCSRPIPSPSSWVENSTRDLNNHLLKLTMSGRIIESMKTVRYVYWQDEDMWLGYIEEFPDYMTQGETLEELRENLRDIYHDLTGGKIPGVRHVAELQIA